MKKTEKKEGIVDKNIDFSRWYSDIIRVASLAEHGASKGSMVIKPHGYALWELIQKKFDARIKKTGVANAYFPLLIPERFLNKEKEHVEGFSPEVAAVTYAGGKKLKEALIIRPTSETVIYHTLSSWVQSHNDLPILLNQWVNVVRWEKRPRLFLRTTEFLWQEGHTVHATARESKKRTLLMLKTYQNFAKEVLAIPTIAGLKTNSEKFAGAKQTYSLEAMMQDGKALQFATSHNLDQNFAKPFKIQYTNKNGVSKYCYQTSWGMSTRVIGALIMVHSDNVGLVLPPKVAPIQVIIVPIYSSEENRKIVEEEAKSLYAQLKNQFRLQIDLTEEHAGEKFYKWERKGVPLRIELGPREVKDKTASIIRRDTGKKRPVAIKDLKNEIRKELKDIQRNLYQKALSFMNERTKEVKTWKDFKEEIKNNNFVIAYFKEDASVEEKIKSETKASPRCILLTKIKQGRCIYSGKPTKTKLIFARAY
ncbi:MAG: proline--tRNA ligase [Candidatus Beckwithbacteria bacterium]